MVDLSRKTINEIFAGKAPITAETAVKLGTLFGNEPLFWFNMQSSYDIWVAREKLQASLGNMKKWQNQMRLLSAETVMSKHEFS